MRKLISTRIPILLSDIIIPEDFKQTPPKHGKVADRMDFHIKHGVFNRDILLDENNLLIDGYAVYLAAKLMKHKKITALQIRVVEG